MKRSLTCSDHFQHIIGDPRNTKKKRLVEHSAFQTSTVVFQKLLLHYEQTALTFVMVVLVSHYFLVHVDMSRIGAEFSPHLADRSPFRISNPSDSPSSPHIIHGKIIRKIYVFYDF